MHFASSDTALAVLVMVTAIIQLATAITGLIQARDEKNRRQAATRRRFRGRKRKRR